MGKAPFEMVAAGDGSPQSPSGYGYYLLAHAIATVLLLITLVAAIWQFMNWVATPSCLADASLSSASSSAAAAPGGTNSSVAFEPVGAGDSSRNPNKPGVSEMALSSGECPSPQ